MNSCFFQSLNRFQYGLVNQTNLIKCESTSFGLQFFNKLLQENLIASVSSTKNLQTQKLYLTLYYKYTPKTFFLKRLIIYSTPSRKIYKTYDQIVFLKKNVIGGIFFFFNNVWYFN